VHKVLSTSTCVNGAQDKTAEKPSAKEIDASDPEQMTEKYGLEAGLLSALRKGAPGKATAKDLLKRYGSAYLITSISLALVSFGLCYLAVSSGVDVPALLSRINIQVASDSAGEKAGTLALAYAAHKALSPVRFPPTVALTPLVAQKLGKDKPAEEEKFSDAAK
jgi:Protein of unknown function (DUF1279)